LITLSFRTDCTIDGQAARLPGLAETGLCVSFHNLDFNSRKTYNIASSSNKSSQFIYKRGSNNNISLTTNWLSLNP